MSDYTTSVACATCKKSMFLSPDSEWPEQELYCWSCAHEQIARLTAERDEARNALRWLWEINNDPRMPHGRLLVAYPWLIDPAAKETNDGDRQ